ncbi:alpha,alpha-phosphotrehalase [Vibrio tapetis]|uniref:Glucan 1,6-alpha-glucosidase n=1 Tax=Vibrio tapetis subsp. tapetis TaxID=1671868 RepID=A0A2N8ZMF3_9VIBR|nr:alpha,alpha-phosphotrehalase [Vibrio tapetis]SON53111.1 Glucan 1,6-alpha-glucosidase [Vibrio tapetis subsp. tapetis]
MEQKWWHDAVVYQIYPRSFCDSNKDGIGDITGIISKLDYLQTLGVNVLWLSPVYQSPMDDNGYDISDYQEIAQEFGSMEDMEALFYQAQQRDIKIVMDLVVNHTSDEHEWFKQARESKDSPYRDFYIWRDAKPDGSVPDDQCSVFGGSAWEWCEKSQQYFYHIFSRCQPDLNWNNPEMVKRIHDMMNWWIDKGIGGFRLDVIDLIGKNIDKRIMGNGPKLHQRLQDMNQATFGDKDLLTVGETWDATPEIAKMYSEPNRNELSMVFQFEHITLTWQDGDKWRPKAKDINALKEVLIKWQLELKDGGWNSLFWNNHDLPRVVSKYGCVGEHRVASAKMLATAMHMMKGTPYIYQGEEIGMTNVAFDSLEDYRDIETLNFYDVKTGSGTSHDEMMEAIYQNSRDNSRTPMQWNGSENAGFTQGSPWINVNPNHKDINVEQALEDNNSIFYHYQSLIALRKAHPAIVYGDFTPILRDNEQIFAYLRHDDNERLLVINNFSNEEQAIVLSEQFQAQEVECLLSNRQPVTELSNKLYLTPYESMVLKLK